MFIELIAQKQTQCKNNGCMVLISWHLCKKVTSLCYWLNSNRVVERRPITWGVLGLLWSDLSIVIDGGAYSFDV